MAREVGRLEEESVFLCPGVTYHGQTTRNGTEDLPNSLFCDGSVTEQMTSVFLPVYNIDIPT